MPFFEASAFNDINVDEAFQRISKDVMIRLETTPITNTPGNNKAFQSTPPPAALTSANGKPVAKKGFCLIL